MEEEESKNGEEGVKKRKDRKTNKHFFSVDSTVDECQIYQIYWGEMNVTQIISKTLL